MCAHPATITEKIVERRAPDGAKGPSPSPEAKGEKGDASKAAWAALLQVVKGTVLEAVAYTVPRKDRVFFAQRWGFVVPEEPQRTPEEGLTVALPREIPLQADTEVEQLVAIKASAHPLLGPMIADFGYKRVHTCALHGLISVPIWEKQRILRPERVKSIARAKLKGLTAGGSLPSLPGVITLYQDRETGQLGILDGQHRLGALMMLAEEKVWDKNAYNIMVDVFETSGETEVKGLFTEINSAEPLKLVDMPGEGADDKLRDTLTAAVDVLAATYPEMFKASQRCRPPHINKDNMRDDIYQSDLMQRHGITTVAELLSHIDDINKKLACRPLKDWTDFNSCLSPSKPSFADALKKARSYNLFLGLDTQWTKL